MGKNVLKNFLGGKGVMPVTKTEMMGVYDKL
jgi:hypothetical protein